MRTLVIAVVLTACADRHPTRAPVNNAATGADDRDWQTCMSDRDCAVVEIGCSDFCGGGNVVSVHRTHAEDARERYRRGLTCAMRRSTNDSCRWGGAICRGGRCGYRWSAQRWDDSRGNFVTLERVIRLPELCTFELASVAIDCDRACESYERFWRPANANACRDRLLQNGHDGQFPVPVTEGGEPYDPSSCPSICRGAIETGMPRENTVSWACFERHASCDDWTKCYAACRRW